jgi:hypothetical protein
LRVLLTIGILCLAIAGCGGGGGSSPSLNPGGNPPGGGTPATGTPVTGTDATLGVLAAGRWEGIVPGDPQPRTDLAYKLRLTAEANGRVFGEIIGLVRNGTNWEETNLRIGFVGLAAAGQFFGQLGQPGENLTGTYHLDATGLVIDVRGMIVRYAGTLPPVGS